jgi:hypothetical protein
VVVTWPVDGTYLIVANTARGGETGNYQISWQTATAQAVQQANQQAEASRLFQQGIQQYRTSQFRAALQSWDQALALY